jgi:hypothetical protein
MNKWRISQGGLASLRMTSQSITDGQGSKALSSLKYSSPLFNMEQSSSNGYIFSSRMNNNNLQAYFVAKNSSRRNVESLLDSFKDIFSESAQLTQADIPGHCILTNGEVVNTRSRPYSPEEFSKLVEEVRKMLQQRIIRSSTSRFSSGIVMVRKKDNTIRFCIDYRKLNSITIPDAYPLPRIDEIIDRLYGAKFFSKMDLRSGFWQIKMNEDDIEKTAFTSPLGLYEFVVMPFGLKNAPASFQRAMDTVLGSSKCCAAYIDDILVWGNTKEEHLENLSEVLKRLEAYNVKLKKEKCVFEVQSVDFLGHNISDKGI